MPQEEKEDGKKRTQGFTLLPTSLQPNRQTIILENFSEGPTIDHTMRKPLPFTCNSINV